jgi:hypothetical protein
MLHRVLVGRGVERAGEEVNRSLGKRRG